MFRQVMVGALVQVSTLHGIVIALMGMDTGVLLLVDSMILGLVHHSDGAEAGVAEVIMEAATTVAVTMDITTTDTIMGIMAGIITLRLLAIQTTQMVEVMDQEAVALIADAAMVVDHQPIHVVLVEVPLLVVA